MNRFSIASGLVALLVSSVGGAAVASSHRETPNTWQDPCTDHTDLYAWVQPGTRDKLYLIQAYNGLHEPGQGNYQTSLCDDVLYEFHIARGNGALDPKVTYQIQFSSTLPTQVNTINDKTPVGGGAELLVQLSGIKQTYTVRRIDYAPYKVTTLGSGFAVSPPNIGPRTDRIAYGLGTFSLADADSNSKSLFNGAFMRTFVHNLADNGGRVWIGEADDPFFFDEDAIFDILNLRGANAKDVFAGFNTNIIALEIPTKLLTGTGQAPAHMGAPGNDTLLGIWNTTSRQKVTIRFRDGERFSYGPWVQVGRQGLPLVNAGLIGTQDQHKYLRTAPKADVANFASYFLYPVLVRDLDFLGVYNALGVPAETVSALKANRTDIIDIVNLTNIPTTGAHAVPIAPGATGDVLRLDMALDSGFPNGRRFEDDVVDAVVTLVVAGVDNLLSPTGLKIGDGVDFNDVPFETEFPFVGVPHEGLAGGHGAPAHKE